MKTATATAREKKPKVRRDGSIIRRGERKFLLRAYRGSTTTGKRLYFTQIFKGTSDDARKRLDQILTDISNGIEPTRTIPEPAKPAEPPPTVGEALDRWLKHKTAAQKARIRTIRNYEWLLNKYVRPTLGAKAIAEITELQIQELYNGLLEGGTVTAKTVRNLHKVLEPAFERAVRWKLIKENPCDDLEIPKWDRKEARYLTPEQTLAFLTAARAKQDKWFAALLLAIETGARPNEYLALRWSDVSFDACSVSIRRSIYWPPGLGRKKAGEGAFEFTKPKTQRSNRTITVSAAAVEALRQHRREQLEERMRKGSDYQDLDLVFATELGTPLLWRNLARRHLKPLLIAAEIPHEGISLYSLRHTAASLLISAGEHVRVIAERLGTSMKMIDDTYSHVPQKLQQTATDRMAKMLHGT